MIPFARSLLLTLLMVAPWPPLGAQSVNQQSPFIPVGGGAANSPQSTAFELVGIIASSKQTLVGITDKTTHRSFWIAVGKTSEGVEVISCDPKQDRAVVKVGGEIQNLTMHASMPTGTAPAAIAVNQNAAPVNQNTPQVEQEREARMLVSDLLEISIQQRKAYEDSQKKTAAEKAAPPPPDASSPPRRR